MSRLDADPIVDASDDPRGGTMGTLTETITPNIDDEDIIRNVKSDMDEHDSRFQKLQEIYKSNKKYFVGKQIDSDNLNPGDAEIVINRVFVAIETIISMLSSVTPYPYVTVTPRNKGGRRLQRKVERHLVDTWEYHLNAQQIMERLLRRFMMGRYAVLKVRWDDTLEQMVAEVVDSKRLRFDLDVDHISKTPYVGEYVKMSIDDAIMKFEESEEYLEELKKEKGGRTKITVIEYWGRYYEDDELKTFVSWVYKDKVLGKEVNPYWNENGGNHFKIPRMPYIVMNAISDGSSLVDDTSLIEQAKSVQDGINKRKRQIDANAGLANGMLVGSAAHMDEETFRSIQMLPKEGIFLNGEVEDVRGAINIVTGRSLDGGVFQDMMHSISEIDNIMGVHATTRGERTGEETAQGRAILRDADYGRQDLISRAYEQVAEELFNWTVQMARVKYDKKKQLIGRDESEDPMENYQKEIGLLPIDEKSDTIYKDDFKDYEVKVIVKKGSVRPTDPAQLQDTAVMLMQTGQLDPLTFHEMYQGELPPDPRKAARRLYFWQNDPISLFPELQGDQLIDFDALLHIKEINQKGYEAEDNLYEVPSVEDIDKYEKHVATHKAYMAGAEIDDDIASYTELPDEIQYVHSEHLKQEMIVLQELSKRYQQQQAMREGNMSPQEVLSQLGQSQPMQAQTGQPPISPGQALT